MFYTVIHFSFFFYSFFCFVYLPGCLLVCDPPPFVLSMLFDFTLKLVYVISALACHVQSEYQAAS